MAHNVLSLNKASRLAALMRKAPPTSAGQFLDHVRAVQGTAILDTTSGNPKIEFDDGSTFEALSETEFKVY